MYDLWLSNKRVFSDFFSFPVYLAHEMEKKYIKNEFQYSQYKLIRKVVGASRKKDIFVTFFAHKHSRIVSVSVESEACFMRRDPKSGCW